MTRSRLVLSFVALLVAWTILVGWFAARWGGVHARGLLPGPIRETVEDPSRPPASDLKLVAFESKELDAAMPNFRSRFQNLWGDETEGQELQVKSTPLAEGGLQVLVSGSNGFSSESVTIDLLHGPESSILARVEVGSFYDGAAEHSTWKQPSGWILVSRRDWSKLSMDDPLYVRFHLMDAADPYGHCVSGHVRIPK
jgi:hypothetical protein